MAEKSKLKGADEILSALGKQSKQSAALSEELVRTARAEATEQTAPVSASADSAPAPSASEAEESPTPVKERPKRQRTSRGGAKKPASVSQEPEEALSAQEADELDRITSALDQDPPKLNLRGARKGGRQEQSEPEDRNPLDFGKYQLAKGAAERQSPKKAAPKAARAAEAAPPPEPLPLEPVAAKKPPKNASAQAPQKSGRAGARTKATEEDAKARIKEAMQPLQEILEEPVASVPSEPVIKEFQFEEFDAPGAVDTESTQNNIPDDVPPAVPPPEPETEPPVAKRLTRRPKAKSPSQQSAEDFFQSLTMRLDSEGDQSALSVVEPTAAHSKKADEKLQPTDTPDPAERQADSFVEQFEEQVRQEEESRAESFKETLAEKFLREREKYLEELGIPAEEPAEIKAAADKPARRRLDIQIQPEMHRQEEEKPKAVTYGPKGDVRPLENNGDAGENNAEPHKKTSEDLLFELAAQNTVKHLQGPRTLKMPSAAGRKKFSAQAPKGAKPVKQGAFPKRAAILAACILLVVAASAWPLSILLRGSSAGSGDIPVQVTGAGEGSGLETLNAYENHNYDVTRDVGVLMVKKANITLANINVANHVIIGEIDTQGEIVLQDMTVGGTIYLQTCGIDTLKLINVDADRIIVSNLDKRVTIQASGTTRIGTAELSTPTTVQQSDGSGGGIENMLLSRAEEAETLDVNLGGLRLGSLAVAGDAALVLADGSSVESLSAEGNLVLSGEGSVFSLAIGSQVPGAQVGLQLRNVGVTKLVVKSPLQALLSAEVDMMTTSDSLSLEGSGVVSTLMLNKNTDETRLPVDISGVTVHAMILDAESLVTVAEGSLVNEITANDSVYTVGEKVSHLVVNANNVVYQNEPDKITVRTGIRPPESLADNPNLDINLSVELGALSADASDDDVATTCNHTRETGGFIVGDGSVSNPFQVSTPAQLAHVGSHLNSHFIQTANIDIAADSQFSSGFPVIAGGGTPFSGSYNGAGYTIANLRIASDGENVGLFGENVGTIKNVNIISGDIQATSSQRSFAGGVVGLNYQNGLVEACSNGAKVSGSIGGYGGGIVGYNYGARIRDCYNYAKISGHSNVGGIVGVNRDNSSVAGSYNAGTINATLDVGAVAGVNTNATITNCYYLKDTAESAIGTGTNTGTVVEKTSDQLSDAQMAKDLAGGDDLTPWTMPSSGSYTYPVLEVPPSSVPVAAQVTQPEVVEAG